MENHVHFIWQACGGHFLDDIQKSFAKYTADQFLKLLKHEKKLELYEVNAIDRKHHFWKRDPLGIELFNPSVFQQKVNYIHNNPVKEGICKYPEAYKYSSASFYHTGKDHTGFLEHWMG